MLICGDMNLPKISWDSSESSTSTCEQCFVDILNDHFLLQVNCLPPCGNYVLDLVISSMPDQVNAFEVINPDEVAILILLIVVYLFVLFYFEQYLVRGAQFSEAGLNGALMKTKTTRRTMTDKKKMEQLSIAKILEDHFVLDLKCLFRPNPNLFQSCLLLRASSLRASSPIWARKASLARTHERGAEERRAYNDLS